MIWYNRCDNLFRNIRSRQRGSSTKTSNNGTGGGGGGAATPAPSPCIVPAANTLVAVTNPNHKTTLVVQYVEGSGFPAPTSTTSAPCNTTTTTTTNQTTPVTQLMKNPNALTPAQIASLQALLNQITNNCIGQALVNNLVSNGRTFNFLISPSSTYPAFYNASSGNITIQNPTILSQAALQEELFHAYQNYKYPNGTAQYAGVSGSANIEFEAKLLRDIAYYIDPNNNGNQWAVIGSNYTNWLGTITNGGTSFPTGFTSSQSTSYYLFINDWLNQNPGYSNDIINYSLNPIAIFSLINSSPCSK